MITIINKSSSTVVISKPGYPQLVFNKPNAQVTFNGINEYKPYRPEVEAWTARGILEVVEGEVAKPVVEKPKAVEQPKPVVEPKIEKPVAAVKKSPVVEAEQSAKK